MHEEDVNGIETWLNASSGWVHVLKFDRRGDVTTELVRGGKKFSLSRQERLLNQDRAASMTMDIFGNGTLSPVRLVDGTDDAAEFAANPNLMSESDMKDLLKGHWKTLESKVQAIGNPITLNRMLALADEVDASMRSVNAVQARLKEVEPHGFEEIVSESPAEPDPGFRPLTPR